MTDRYEKTDHNTVIDTKTGLEWQAKSFGPMTWQDAMNHAASLGDGWRMPTIDELYTLADHHCGSLATTIFQDNDQYWYWSSSLREVAESYAWGMYFVSGRMDVYSKTNFAYTRCVRGKEK